MRIQNYEVGEPFFEAGPSTFFAAKNVVLSHPVIVRRLTIDPARASDVRETFYRESRHAASLWHPHIWKPLDVMDAEGFLWSVHENRVARGSDVIVKERGPFGLAAAARLGVQMADALAHMHARGAVHGKVAPRFVTVDEDGNGLLINLVKSADLASGIWPLRPVVVGLSPFSAPEEFAGAKPGPAADVYGLAATVLFWLTGRLPRGGDGDEALERARVGGPVDTAALRQDVPPSLAGALRAALEVDPEKRPGSVAALGSLLAELERRHAADVPAGFEPGALLKVGGDLGDVRVVERHGAGAYGIVFRARASAVQGDVAVKALKPEHRDDREALERFLREARALEGIRHDNVIHILAVGEQRGTPYVVMEFVPGPDLATLLLKEGVFEPTRAARLLAGVARGLEAIHKDGILHRDLKPHNVLVAPGGRAVIADFGVARNARAERMTMTGQLVGSPAYMAPETFDERPPTAAVDLYALGAMLYELLTGSPPFVGSDTFTTIRRIREDAYVPLPQHVPVVLQGIVDRLLAKEPGQRYARAAALAHDLEAVAGRMSAPAATP